MVAEQAVDEAGSRRERLLGLVALRRVPRARQHDGLDRAETLVARDLELTQRAILIVLTLHNEDRHADITEHFGDIPMLKFRIEPGLGPRAEGAIDIIVPTLEFLAQAARGELVLCSPDLVEPHLLGKEVWRNENET